MHFLICFPGSNPWDDILLIVLAISYLYSVFHTKIIGDNLLCGVSTTRNVAMYLWMLLQMPEEAKQRYFIVLYIGIFTCINKISFFLWTVFILIYFYMPRFYHHSKILFPKLDPTEWGWEAVQSTDFKRLISCEIYSLFLAYFYVHFCYLAQHSTCFIVNSVCLKEENRSMLNHDTSVTVRDNIFSLLWLQKMSGATGLPEPIKLTCDHQFVGMNLSYLSVMLTSWCQHDLPLILTLCTCLGIFW